LLRHDEGDECVLKQRSDGTDWLIRSLALREPEAWNKMNISIFGIGYVGAVAAACLARDGHEVVAVDINPDKVDDIARGRSPIVEPRLAELISRMTATGQLRATCSTDEAIAATDLSFVCVGTPSRANGSLNTAHVAHVSKQIGTALRQKNDYHSVVVRSTMLPGTMESLVIPEFEKCSNKIAGDAFGVAYYPEFLREGSAIADYDNPGAIVLGVHDPRTCSRMLKLHSHMSVRPRTMSIRAAEALKYVNNAWHALKISFANEIGLVSKALEFDSFDVMDALCADTKLNISAAYLKPGFAFGGSCLPKDLRALRHCAHMLDVETPVLDGVWRANENQLEAAYRIIEQSGRHRVGLIGLSFKPETDDLRSSPFVQLAERLIGRGYRVKVYDPIIRLSSLNGANRAYLLEHLRHIADLLLERPDDLLADSDVIVVGNSRECQQLLEKIDNEDKLVIDLVRVDRSRSSNGSYQGLCW
jgi:GDP-mannose 6-dehydrogenase